MSIVRDIARATRPHPVQSAHWNGVQFRVREVSVGEAMAAGGITEKVLGSLIAAATSGDGDRAVKLAGRAALEWARHHEAVACMAVMGMRQWDGEGEEPAWEPVRIVQSRPDPDNPPDDCIWAGSLGQTDLQAIYAIAMGAASRAALSAGPFRHPAEREGEPGGEEAGRDGEALRDLAEPAAVSDPDGAGEE